MCAKLDFSGMNNGRYGDRKRPTGKKPDFPLDDEQQAIVDTPGSLEVWAGPGTGKTALSGARAKKAAKGGTVLATAFSRSAASELEERFSGIVGIKIATIHGQSYDGLGGREWAEGWKKKRKGETLRDLQNPVVTLPGVGNIYEAQIKGFLALPEVEQYDTVLCDEWQDLTDDQYKVVKKVTRGELFVVGDPFQQIYQFRGSRWHPTEAPKKMLLNDYRNSPEVLELLEELHKRGLRSTYSGYRDGTVGILSFNNRGVQELSSWLKPLGVHHNVAYRDKKGWEASFHDPHRESSVEDRVTYLSCGGNCEECKKVSVMTYHHAKGLEFDAVFLLDNIRIGNEYVPYVGISRARLEAFCISVSYGRGSPLRDLFEDLGKEDKVFDSYEDVPWKEIIEKFSLS